MADLTDLQASQSVKITGANSSGVEDNYAEVSSENKLQVQTPTFATVTNTRPNVTNSSSTILASNSNRKYAHISNLSGSTIWIKFTNPAVSNQGIQMSSGSIFFINSSNLFTGEINAIKNGGGSVNLDVCEGTT